MTKIDLEGAGPSVPCEAMGAFFGSDEAMVEGWGLFRFRGCEGPQPSRSGVTIKALILIRQLRIGVRSSSGKSSSLNSDGGRAPLCTVAASW